MRYTTTGSAGFSLHLTAPAGMGAVAATILARHLGISEDNALRRLSGCPGPIANGLDAQAAKHLLTLLSTLGLRLRLRPDGDKMQQCDLSVQLSVWANPSSAARLLAAALSRDEVEVAAALAQPGGLVLQGLGPMDARRLQDRLASIRGLVVLRSDHDGALYDLFATRPLTEGERVRLSESLRLIGARTDPVTGTCAGGLGSTLRDHLLSRLPDLDLVALDRAIQRFDLYLIGVTGWVTKDLADFLAARTGQPRARFEVISPTEPVRLDHGLSHAVLRQFCADYAAIGLMTRPLLRGLPGFPDNPTL